MKKYWIASALFFLFLLLVFRGFVFDESRLLLDADQLKSMGTRYISDALVLPAWDDTRLGGIPTLDAMFGDAYHPLRLLQCLLDPARAVGWKFVLCVQIAFMGGLLLFSRLAHGMNAGIAVSALFALSPAFFSLVYPGHDGKMMAISALPWLLWGLVKLAKDGRLWGGAAMALALLWMLLSSHLQAVYFALWGLLFLSLFLVFSRKEIPLRARLLRQGVVGAAVAAALAAASFQILPQRAYVAEFSVRGDAEHSSYGHAVSWSLHPEELATLLLPGFVSRESDRASEDGAGVVEKHYWGRNFLKLDHNAVGAMLLLLALVGFSARRYRLEGAFWLGASALTIAYSLGAHTPLFRLFYAVLPGVGSFRAPAIAAFWLPMACAWMGARAFAAADERRSLAVPLGLAAGAALVLVVARRAWESFLGAPAAVAVLLFAVVALAAVAARERGEAFSPASVAALFKGGIRDVPIPTLLAVGAMALVLVWAVVGTDVLYSTEGVRDYFAPLHAQTMAAEAGASVVSLVFVLLSAGLLFRFGGRIGDAKPLCAIAALGLAELLWTDLPFVQTVPREKAVPAALKAQWADLQRRDGALPPNDYRLFALGGINENLGGFAGFRSVLGFHDNELASFREFTGGRSRARLTAGLRTGDFSGSPYLNLLGGRYLLSGGRLAVNEGALPRVALFDSALVLPAAEQLALLDRRGVDERAVVLLESGEGVADVHPAARRPFPGEARVVENPSPDRLVAETECDRPTVLLHSENWMPGWRATVNGKEAPVLRAFTTLQAVPLPAGKNRVELVYRSPEVARVLPLSAAGFALVLLLCGLGAAQLVRERRRAAA